jgi:hypothetical protein
VRAGNGSALSIVWAVSASGSTITRRGDSGDQMGLATQISSERTADHLVVSGVKRQPQGDHAASVF